MRSDSSKRADIIEDGAADDSRRRHDRPVVHEVVAKLVRAFGIEAAHSDDAAVRRIIAREIDEIAVHEADLAAACKAGSWRASFTGVQKSSPSRMAINSLCLAQSAIARGGLSSPGVSMILSFSISPVSRASTTFDPSCEPSLTTMISRTASKAVCASTLRTACSIVPSSLWHVMTTDTLTTLPPGQELPANGDLAIRIEEVPAAGPARVRRLRAPAGAR